METAPVIEPHREPDLVVADGTPAKEPSPPAGPSQHRVAPGETLFRIAKNHGVTVAELAKANGIDDPTRVVVGQVLQIPDARVEPKREDAPPRRSVAPALPEGEHLRWPVRGVLYARFGKKGKQPHDGIDLAAPEGTPVQTAAPGTVLYAGEQKAYGRIAIVEHEHGLITLYAHNRDLRVKTGQRVREGQVIATVGQSGKTSGPHLHFEVRKNGVPVDPLLFLEPISKAQARRRP